MGDGLTVSTGAGSVAQTVTALHAALRSRGIQLFATIDHAAGAAAVGASLADEVVVIFGNPAVGTPLMQADPRAGIELPLRMLIWDDGGSTRIAYADPHALATRFDVAATTAQLDGMAGLLSQLVSEIADPRPTA